LPPRALSLESGCKDKAIISLFPNILAIIFQVFFSHHRKILAGKTLGRKVFSPPHGKKGPSPPASPGSRRDSTGKTTGKKIIIPEYTPFKDARERL
ncbi:MAG: hypothetical protein KH112_16345, partial [Sanguibacteroides justesenii]|nr:hypothetical protein [Sanguibacteroides justesenii]